MNTLSLNERRRATYDLNLLRRWRFVSIGCGGSAACAQEVARAGIHDFVLIDPDTVSEGNLATQAFFRSDIGQPKVECLARRILDINPCASVVRYQKWLDDISDIEFQSLLWRPPDELSHGCPLQKPVLLCGFTDSFQAQARINRLALHFAVSSLCAQHHREARTSEVTFTHPELTPACHRCILSKRYAADALGENTNIASTGAPVCCVSRLNSLSAFVALMLLHTTSSHPRWTGLLKRIATRNLAMIRHDPDVETTLGVHAFTKSLIGSTSEAWFADETIWRPQKPECPANGYPPCPDCGGSGDLRALAGTFSDTRLIRPQP
jgi:hypothetical protein